MGKMDRRIIPSGKFCSGDMFSDGCDFLLEDDGKGYCCLLQKRLEECDINEESFVKDTLCIEEYPNGGVVLVGKNELLKQRIKEKFKNRELTEEEVEGLKRVGNEDLIQYSRSLLRDSKEHNECD